MNKQQEELRKEAKNNRDPLMNEMWSPNNIGGNDIRKDFIARCHVGIKDGGFLVFPFAVKQNNYKPEPFFSPKALFDWFLSKLTLSESRVREEAYTEGYGAGFYDKEFQTGGFSKQQIGRMKERLIASLTKKEGE